MPNGETLAKFAEYFGVSTDYLLGLKDIIDCPYCGERYETGVLLDGNFKLDGSFNLDGTVNLKGIKCPHCGSADKIPEQLKQQINEKRKQIGDASIHMSNTVSDTANVGVQGVNNGSVTMRGVGERVLPDDEAELLRIYRESDFRGKHKMFKVAFEVDEENAEK